MEQEGRERMHRFAASLERFMESAGTLKHLRLADDSVCGKFHIKDRDDTSTAAYFMDMFEDMFINLEK